MNVRRGYVRLSVAVIGFWVVTWACVAGFAAWQQGMWSDIYIEASKADKLASIEYANEQSSFYAKIIVTALACEFMTIPLMIISLLGWWVYKGFASDPNSGI